MAWTTSDTSVFALAVVVAVVIVFLLTGRASWYTRRLVATAALIAVASVFAVLARGDVGEQHFSGATPSPQRMRDATFGFVVVGDFGTGGDQQYHVSRAVRAWTRGHRTDAFISAGDTIYPSGDPRYFEESWIEPYGWLYDDGIEVIGSLGNHDYAAGDRGRAVMQLLEMPARWYRVALGDADVIVLDGNVPDHPAQSRWLARQLRVVDKPWTIVVVHQPPYSCSRAGDERVRDAWVALMEDRGVDLVISGHEHNYQRLVSAAGTTYVVTGGGGDSLYEIGDCDTSTPRLIDSDDENFHFLTIEGSDSRLKVQAVALDASILDTFTLVR